MIPFYIVCVSALHERKSSGCLSVYAKLPWLSISCCTCAKLCESEHGSHLHCIVCWYILYYLVCIRIVCISNYAGSSAKSRLPSLRLHDSSRARLLLSFSVWPAMTCSFINILLFVFCAVAATAAAATAEMVNVKCCSATATAQWRRTRSTLLIINAALF